VAFLGVTVKGARPLLFAPRARRYNARMQEWSTANDGSHGRRRRGADVLLGAAIIAATLVAYVSAIRAGYIWDDDSYVHANPVVTAPDGWWRVWVPRQTPQYYPLVFLTFWNEAHLWGVKHPSGFHAINVILHGISGVLVWVILRRLGVPGAWLAGAVFALHPVHVESVAWITERKNVLSGVFYFAAFLGYLRYADGKGRVHYVASLVFYAMALLSKTVTCTLPAALLIVTWSRGRRIDRRLLLSLAPMVVLGAALGAITVWMERTHVGASGVEWHVTLPQKLILASRALWFYAAKIVFPYKLTFIYPRWALDARSAAQWLWVVATIAAFALAFVFRSRIGRGPVAALLFFAVTLGPALGFIQVYPMRYSFVADHFQYLASLGVIVLGTAIGALAFERLPRPAQAAACGTLIAMLGVLTWLQSMTYADEETLWRETIARNPAAWIAHNNLGVLLDQRGEGDDAIRHYSETLRLKPDHVEAMNNLGLLFAARGHYEQAIEWYRTALTTKSDAYDVRVNLGMSLLAIGRPGDALDEFENVIRNQESSDDTRGSRGTALAENGRGLALAQLGGRLAAADAFRRATELDPSYVEAWSNLGLALQSMGRGDEAIAALRQALALDPSFEQARLNLGIILTGERAYAEALRVFREGADRVPESLLLRMNLAWLLATTPMDADREPDAAIEIARSVCEATRFEHARSLDALAAAYASAGRFEDAIRFAERAAGLAQAGGQTSLAAEVSSRLEGYRAGRPHRLP
jgi:tetratricopeptide (TPR) repeat protein